MNCSHDWGKTLDAPLCSQIWTLILQGLPKRASIWGLSNLSAIAHGLRTLLSLATA